MSRLSWSYFLNIALIVAIGCLVRERLAPTPSLAASSSSHPASPATPAATVPRRLRYGAFRSPTDRRRSLVERLRELGVPNDVLALVARVDFETEWDPRFAACHGATSKLQAVQLEMELSRDAEMRAALGDAGFREWDQKCMLWEAMSTAVDVTPAEGSAIYGLKKALQQRQHEIEQARLNGTMDDTQVNQAYDQAYAGYFAQLKSVLGDDRYAKSQQLDDAFLTDNLRSELAKVNPTDAQIQQLLTVDKASRESRLELDHQFQDDLSSPAYQEKLNAMAEAENEEYERILGSDAYQTFQKSQDPAYNEMKKYETHWGLTDDQVDYVYGAMKSYAQQVDDLKAQVHALQTGGQAVDWITAQQKLQQLTNATQQALQNNLGASGFNALQRNGVLQFVQIQRAPGRS